MQPIKDIDSLGHSANPLVRQIQGNCNIADAHSAQEYPLCIYLLKMRDYFRWHHDLPVNAKPNNQQLGQWISQKENEWDEMLDKEFEGLKIGSGDYDVFDVESINQSLLSQGLIYGAGFGLGSLPHFFLGSLVRSETINGFEMCVVDTEFARDLTAIPAVMQDQKIIIRRDAVLRLVCEKIEEWQWKKQQTAMSRAMDFYPFEDDFCLALDEMTDEFIETLIMHEVGEAQIGVQLGEQWGVLLQREPGARLERMLRATRDLWADCLTTLPGFITGKKLAAIHFYFANFEGFRKQLWPKLYESYKHFVKTGSLEKLQDDVEFGMKHWPLLLSEIINQSADSRQKNSDLEAKIESFRLT